MISKHHILIFIALLALGFLTYANGLQGPFMLDDHAFFDAKIKDIHSLASQLIPGGNEEATPQHPRAAFYYRPFALMIPTVQYYFFGENPVGFHVTNLILWCVASFVLYVFIERLFKNFILALTASILYLVHPINGVMVNYITASVFSAQVIFMLGSLLCLLEYHVRSKKREVRGGQSFTSYFLLLTSYFFFLLALFCHETAMALPFYATVMVYVLDARRGTACRALPQDTACRIPTAWAAFTQTRWLWISMFTYFLFRLQFNSLHQSILGKFARFHMNAFEYMASLTKLMAWYLGKLIYPKGIVLIWSTPVVRENVITWLVLFVILGGAFYAAFWYYHKIPAVTIGLSWLAIGFIPAAFACLFQPPHGPMIEPHWFVFSSIGFFMCLGHVISQLKIRWALTYVFILSLSWMLITHGYNKMWANEKKYCHYWLSQSPQLKAVWYFLGTVYMQEGQWPRAELCYQRSFRDTYQDWMTYQWMGIVKLRQERWREAKADFLAALKLEGRLPIVLNNLGAIYYREGDLSSAKDCFARAIRMEPSFLSARRNLEKILRRERL